jgi:hypothetical protein
MPLAPCAGWLAYILVSEGYQYLACPNPSTNIAESYPSLRALDVLVVAADVWTDSRELADHRAQIRRADLDALYRFEHDGEGIVSNSR